MEELSYAQRAALRHVGAQATGEGPRARAALSRLLRETGASQASLNDARERLQAHARVVLHFHPDRLNATGRSVADHLLHDGLYRNQFETGLSNGSLSAFKGGDRDLWEAKLFGGAYQAHDVAAAERPKYGALDFLRYADGPAPRFGSCYLVLKPSIADRCTFTLGDSHQPTGHVAIRGAMDGVMLGLLTTVASGQWDLGIPHLTVPDLLDRLSHGLGPTLPDPAEQAVGRLLDHYIEAQIHGPVDLRSDVEMLVADPAFQGTPTGKSLHAACSRHGIALRWHPGFVLPVKSVSSSFRGPAMPLLAQRIAEQGLIDAAIIGIAAASLHRQPERWHDWGTYGETLQQLKQLWHVLVHQGMPAARQQHETRR